MRKKEQRLIITFESTLQAMKLERTAKEVDAPGRIIPVPKEITAGCGLAFSAPPQAKPELMELLRRKQIEAEQILELFI